tara:strand:+ start:2912 stop:3814 length:903 start_codon:yes stop_codon:yes gene_type:complete
MSNPKVRVYKDEALSLGIEPRPNQRGRSNTEYRLDRTQQENLKELRKHKKIKRLFFDIETSPMVVYSWRTGWKINIHTDNIIQDWKIICISYKWEGSDKVQTLKWDKNKCDKKLLQEFIKIANLSDEMVAHNGDRFDIKKIRTRCIFHRIPTFPKYRTLDTLKKAKSGFNFNSNRLDYIAKFLGVGAKLKHEGFPMWVKCMQGDKQALKDMTEYCEMDIIVLEDVYNALEPYILNNTHAGTLQGGFKHECPTCGGEDAVLLKNAFTAKGTIKRVMECDTCEYVYEISNADYRLKTEFKKL